MSKAIVFRSHNNEKVYPCPYMPVGSIYISVNTTNPNTYFGGTWERIKGRFLLGADDSSYKINGTGGEATHKLTINEIPAHTHPIKSGYGDMDSTAYDSYRYQYWGHSANGWKTGDLGAGSTGGSQAHNNMPPYLVVYIWKRTK